MQVNFIQLVSVAFLTAVIISIIAIVLWNKSSVLQARQTQLRLEENRNLEKEIHVRERDFLAERNQLELKRSDDVRQSQAEAFEKGRQHGIIESKAIHIAELTQQRSDLLAKVEVEKARAVDDAINRLRAEQDLQQKLFAVKITPYVRVTEDKGLFRHDYETATGYQYQLLVNGIPAFAPHVVAESTETSKVFNKEIEDALISTAKRAANGAIDMYLGGHGQFAAITEPIVKKLQRTSA